MTSLSLATKEIFLQQGQQYESDDTAEPSFGSEGQSERADFYSFRYRLFALDSTTRLQHRFSISALPPSQHDHLLMVYVTAYSRYCVIIDYDGL